MNKKDSPKDLIRKWVDNFNLGDAKALSNMYHLDGINHQVTNEPVIGREAIFEMFKSEFEQADMTCLIENTFEDGDFGIFRVERPSGVTWMWIFPI